MLAKVSVRILSVVPVSVAVPLVTVQVATPVRPPAGCAVKVIEAGLIAPVLETWKTWDVAPRNSAAAFVPGVPWVPCGPFLPFVRENRFVIVGKPERAALMSTWPVSETSVVIWTVLPVNVLPVPESTLEKV